MWFKCNSPATIRTVSRRSGRTRARTFSTLLSVFEVGGPPQRGSSLVGSQPSENNLYHLNICDVHNACSPLACFSLLSFDVSLPKFDTKLDCTSLLEFALFHFRDTQTHTHTHTHTHTTRTHTHHTHTHTPHHTHTHTHKHAHTRTRTGMRRRTHARTHARTHTRTHACTHTHTHTHSVIRSTNPLGSKQAYKT